MASPQTENGYSRLANEIIEALIKNPPTSVAARQIWDWTWRNSWGRRGANCTPPTSVRLLSEELGIARSHLARQLTALIQQHRIVRLKDNSLAIEKDYEKWADAVQKERPQNMNLNRAGVPSHGTVDGKQVSPPTGHPVPSHGTPCPLPRDETVPSHGTVYKEKERKKERRKNVERGNRIFSAPSIDEVRDYCLERKNKIDPSYWVDYWITRGWIMKGGQKMKDWKAAVRTWEKNSYGTSNGNGGGNGIGIKPPPGKYDGLSRKLSAD